MTQRMITGPEIEAMIDEIRRAGREAGRAAARLSPECMLGHVTVGTGAMMLGVAQIADVLIDRLETEGASGVTDCSVWVASCMFHNGETAWRRMSNQPQFAPHCSACGGLTYEVGYAQYRAGMMAVLGSLSQIAVIEGGGYEINPLRVRQVSRTCEAQLQAQIEEVFRR
ncbi:hypothetical protein SEA_MARIOKART_59 [Gordonia phage Mariokart]|nr:hypothetical protein SEA_MARIOKART_59 [Gordonia phage Mariokart]